VDTRPFVADQSAISPFLGDKSSCVMEWNGMEWNGMEYATCQAIHNIYDIW